MTAPELVDNSLGHLSDPSQIEAAARQLLDIVARTSSPRPPDRYLVDITSGALRCMVVQHSQTSDTDVELNLSRSLSPREQEVARMVAKGLTTRAIANVLEISSWTVSTHLKRIFAKLEVTSRAAMVARLLTVTPQQDARGTNTT